MENTHHVLMGLHHLFVFTKKKKKKKNLVLIETQIQTYGSKQIGQFSILMSLLKLMQSLECIVSRT